MSSRQAAARELVDEVGDWQDFDAVIGATSLGLEAHYEAPSDARMILDERAQTLLATFYFLALTIVVANVLVFWTPMVAPQK